MFCGGSLKFIKVLQCNHSRWFQMRPDTGTFATILGRLRGASEIVVAPSRAIGQSGHCLSMRLENFLRRRRLSLRSWAACHRPGGERVCRILRV